MESRKDAHTVDDFVRLRAKLKYGMALSVVLVGEWVCSWGVWSHLKDIVDSFKKTMPLIMDLRNSAIRPRHWQTLMDMVGEQFDPDGEDFTLDKVRLEAQQKLCKLRVPNQFCSETSPQISYRRIFGSYT